MTSKTTFAALCAVLFAASGAFAQNTPHIVHYDDATIKASMPNFHGVVICFNNIGGKLENDARRDLMKIGVRDFLEGSVNCRGVSGQTFIRIGLSKPYKMQASSISISTSGSVPGYSSSGSSSNSGDWIAVTASATLVRADGTYEQVGFNAKAFQAGNFSNFSSGSYGNTSSSGGISQTTPEDQAAGMAMSHSLHDLIHSAKSWKPGSAETVAKAFNQPWPPKKKG